jgi:UMF1 family MFS transporter
MSIANATNRSKLATWSWALWGWAEHVYPTIMQTFIFATYITSGLFGKNKDLLSSQLGLATGIAGLLVAVFAPVLGQRADASGRRKRSLLTNSALLILIMFASYFVMPDPKFFLFGLVLYALGSVVQEVAFVNYYAMLKQVSTPSTMARVSGFAWALGYVGGIALLLISLIGFVLPDHPWFGVTTDGSQNIRIIFAISAIWMLIFSIPMVIWMPELPANVEAEKVSFIGSYRVLYGKLKGIRKNAPDLLRFLIASAIFRDGLAGVFQFGAVLGSVAFGFSTQQVIFYGIGASIVAGIGATIQFSLTGVVIAGLSIFLFAGAGQITYWVGGLSLSLFVGPAQASARTFLARITPAGREGEFFGLYQTTGEAASFVAPFLWWLAITLASAAGVANATIYGVFGIVVMLVTGIALMARVHPNPAVAE